MKTSNPPQQPAQRKKRRRRRKKRQKITLEKGQALGLLMSCVAWACMVSAMSTNKWIDDSSRLYAGDYRIFFGLEKFELTGDCYLNDYVKAGGTYSYYDGDDKQFLIDFYGEDKKENIVEGSKSMLACSIMSNLACCVTIAFMILNIIKPRAHWTFPGALIASWITGLLIIIGLICFISFIRSELEGDMGYNDSFVLFTCSGIFVGIGSIAWWYGAPTETALRFGSYSVMRAQREVDQEVLQRNQQDIQSRPAAFRKADPHML